MATESQDLGEGDFHRFTISPGIADLVGQLFTTEFEKSPLDLEVLEPALKGRGDRLGEELYGDVIDRELHDRRFRLIVDDAAMGAESWAVSEQRLRAIHEHLNVGGETEDVDITGGTLETERERADHHGIEVRESLEDPRLFDRREH